MNQAPEAFGTLLYRGDQAALADLRAALADWLPFYRQHAEAMGVDVRYLKQVWRAGAQPWEVILNVGGLHHWVFEADWREPFDEIVEGVRDLVPVGALAVDWDSLGMSDPETPIEEFFGELSAALGQHG